MKKILILILVVLLVITIFILNINQKKLIFKIGDSISLSINSNNLKSFDNYYKDIYKNNYKDYIIYGKDKYKIGELERDINRNIKVNDFTIQNLLIKSDILIIEIGQDEMIFSINTIDIYSYLDTMVKSITNLVNEIRKYNKEKIIFVGYFNSINKDYQKYFDYINIRIENICKKYNIIYINPIILNNNKYFSIINNKLNDLGYKKLNELIISNI